MITKLVGREKVVWLSVANKVNEIIDMLNSIEEEENKKNEEQTETIN